jgi:hypothetical protein
MKRLHTALSAIAIALALSGAAHAQAVQGLDGRWEGPVDLPTGATITGVFRIETKNGVTTAVMDVPEQGVRNFPATVTREGAKIAFDVSTIGLNYTGTLSADGKSMTGELGQGGGAVPVTLKHTSDSAAYVSTTKTGPLVQGLDGAWRGAVGTPVGDITVVFRLSSDAKGTITVMDSPDQNIKDIPATARRDGAAVTIAVPGVSGSFAGQVAADGNSIAGMWDQLGQSFPLTVTKK